jgi:hypothetical protein
MPIKRLALSILLLLAACPGTRAQTLEGTWIAVNDITGVVYPHLEELRIARDGSFETVIYGTRHLPQCEDKPLVQTGTCALGQSNFVGQLSIDNATARIVVNAHKLSGSAMSGIGTADDERWALDLLWFGPGEPWTFRQEANVLAMARRSQPTIPGTELDGSKTIVVEKQFYAVDGAFAGELIAFVAGGEYSLVRMACIMPFIAGEATPTREFRTLMRDVAAVGQAASQKRADFLASVQKAPPSPEAVEAFAQVQSTLAAANGAPTAADISTTAIALGLRPEQVERFVREVAMRRRAGPADTLVFSMLEPYASKIRDCHKRYFE